MRERWRGERVSESVGVGERERERELRGQKGRCRRSSGGRADWRERNKATRKKEEEEEEEDARTRA